MTHDFRQDYETLALDERADWQTALVTYRRQVNLWHPDRFVDRPRERAAAQRRFIQLTRAFDSLRAFHRRNRRLPFEPIRRAAPESRAGASARNARSTSARPDESARSGDDEHVASEPEGGLLDAGRTLRPRGRRSLRYLWPASAALLLGATVALFVVMDRNARQATLEEGRDVLRRTAPSEYMPSAAEVQRRSSRGAFVEREDSGKIGDQLMEDVFR